MALLFLESFDLDSGHTLSKWGGFTDNTYINFGTGRTGNALRLGSVTPVKSFAARSTVIAGFALKRMDSYSGSLYFAYFYDGSNKQVQFKQQVDGSISVENIGGIAIATSAPGVLPRSSSWAYVEIKVTFHTTAGSIVIKVNGTEVMNVTNKNTASGTSVAQATSLALSGYISIDLYIDDLYICDTTGADHNDFLGDLSISVLTPTSDTHGDFTPSTGTDHFALVDEIPSNTTDYNSSQTVGQYDTFGLSNLPAEALTVLGVQVTTNAQKNAAGSRSLSTLVKTDAGTYEAAADALGGPGGWTPYSKVLDVDPNDSSTWTPAKVNAMETGYKVAA